MRGAEPLPLTPLQQWSRAGLLLAEQSLAAYLEREQGEMLATGQAAALKELEKIHAAMLEELGEPGGTG